MGLCASIIRFSQITPRIIRENNLMMLRRRAIALSLIFSMFALPLLAQTSDRDKDILERIRKEGMEHSQIMKTMHMLADVYGPRLTGSPNHKAYKCNRTLLLFAPLGA